MTNEELKAKVADLNSVEEAYALSKECGYAGTMEEFKAECDKAAGNNEQMDVEAMETVAGGLDIGLKEAWAWFLKPAVEKLGDKLLDTVDRIVEDPVNEIKKLINAE